MLEAHRLLSDRLRYQGMNRSLPPPSHSKKNVILGAVVRHSPHVWTSEGYTGKLNLKASLDSEV